MGPVRGEQNTESRRSFRIAPKRSRSLSMIIGRVLKRWRSEIASSGCTAAAAHRTVDTARSGPDHQCASPISKIAPDDLSGRSADLKHVSRPQLRLGEVRALHSGRLPESARIFQSALTRGSPETRGLSRRRSTTSGGCFPSLKKAVAGRALLVD